VLFAWRRLRLPAAENWTEPEQKAPVGAGDTARAPARAPLPS
jgi:hypothetical protein